MRNNIKIAFLVVCISSTANGMETFISGLEKFTKKIDSSIDSACDWAYDNPKYSVPIAGATTIGLSFLAFKKSKKLQNACQNIYNKSLDKIADNIIFPVALKWEIIKDEGITKEDIAYCVGLLILGYGIKKSNDYFMLTQKGKNLSTTSLKKVWNIIKVSGRYSRNNKIDILAGLSGAALSYIVLDIYNEIQEYQKNRPLKLSDLFATLSNEQRQSILNSDDLVILISNASNNPHLLAENKEFMHILNEDQKIILEKIIQLFDSGL